MSSLTKELNPNNFQVNHDSNRLVQKHKIYFDQALLLGSIRNVVDFNVIVDGDIILVFSSGLVKFVIFAHYSIHQDVPVKKYITHTIQYTSITLLVYTKCITNTF